MDAELLKSILEVYKYLSKDKIAGASQIHNPQQHHDNEMGGSMSSNVLAGIEG